MSVQSLFSPNDMELKAASLDVSGAISAGSLALTSVTVSGNASIGGVTTLSGLSTDNTSGVVVGADVSGILSKKTMSEITTTPTWVWTNGANPQPDAIFLKAIRSGSYCQCQLLVQQVSLAGVGTPYTATFSLPYPTATPFAGEVGELIGTASFDPTDSSGVTRCVVSARSGTNNQGQIVLENVGNQIIDLSVTFTYSDLA